MNIIDELRKAIEIIQLKEKTILKVAKNKNAIAAALVITGIAGLLSSILTLNGSTIAFSIIGSLIGLVVVVVLVWGISKIFSGKATFMQVLIPVGYSELLGWVAILATIPYLGRLVQLITGLWSIVVLAVVIKHTSKFEWWKAIVTTIIAFVALMIIVVATSVAMVPFTLT